MAKNARKKPPVMASKFEPDPQGRALQLRLAQIQSREITALVMEIWTQCPESRKFVRKWAAKSTVASNTAAPDAPVVQPIEFVDPHALRSLPELAPQFGCHPEYLRQMAAKGKFRAWSIGGSWITTAPHVQAWIDHRRPRGRPRKERN
ncbi:MAG TPA: hypothetical protein VGP72_32295 [Planctomycetota bacterium]|jgi:hypothetical protein